MLHKIYKSADIKLKVVRINKEMPYEIVLDFPDLHAKLDLKMRRIEKIKTKIIFLDEVVFTKNTLQKKSYSNKGTNISVD